MVAALPLRAQLAQRLMVGVNPSQPDSARAVVAATGVGGIAISTSTVDGLNSVSTINSVGGGGLAQNVPGYGVFAKATGNGSVAINPQFITVGGPSGGTSGILAQTFGSGSITINGSASGYNSAIIAQALGGGSISILIGSNTTSRAGTAITAMSAGAGPINVFIAFGQVSTAAGSGFAALDVSGGSGAATINVWGKLVGGSGGADAAIFRGTMTIGNGTQPAIGDVQGNIVMRDSASLLRFNRPDIFHYSDSISGPGSVETLVGGTVVLGGNNTYTGTTSVNGASTLIVKGSIAASSMTTVNAGGTLAGNGVVGSATIADGARLVPGMFSTEIGIPFGGGNTPLGFNGQPATLTISGSLTMSTAASYVVFGNATTISSTHVTGTARLDGTIYIDLQSGTAYRPTRYTLLTADGGLGGTSFSAANITGSLGPLVRNPHLAYDANNVYFVLDPLTISQSLAANASFNQRNVAAGIDNAILAGATLPGGFNTLIGLTGTTLGNALNQLTGESSSATTQTALDASNSFMGAMFDPFDPNRFAGAGGAASGYAAESNEQATLGFASKATGNRAERDALAAIYTKTPRNELFESRWNVWGTTYGGNSTTSGNAAVGSNSVSSRAYGVLTGADYNIGRNTLIGFALGGGGTSFGVAQGLGFGNAEMFQAGLYAKHQIGAGYVSGGLAYTFQDVTTNRIVTIAGVDQLQAKFNANTTAARVEGGYRFATPVAGISPYVAFQLTRIELPAYGEVAISGANTFALNYASQGTTVTRSELGARLDRSHALQTALLMLRGRVAWAHDEGNDRNVQAVFGSLPGSNFSVSGAVPAKDLALVSAGAEVKWVNNFSLAATFEGQFSSSTEGYGGKGTVRYVW